MTKPKNDPQFCDRRLPLWQSLVAAGFVPDDDKVYEIRLFFIMGERVRLTYYMRDETWSSVESKELVTSSKTVERLVASGLMPSHTADAIITMTHDDAVRVQYECFAEEALLALLDPKEMFPDA